MSKTHKIKIWPSYFAAIERGDKTFEWRRNDRDYAVGDMLVLREWDPAKGEAASCLGYTGSSITARITYKVEGVFGMPAGFCILGIKPMTLGEGK